MDENKNIDQLREQGWEEMSTLLDTHLPTDKKRPVLWWYRLAGAAALALLVAVSIPLWMNDEPSGVSTETSLVDGNETAPRTSSGDAGNMANNMEIADLTEENNSLPHSVNEQQALSSRAENYQSAIVSPNGLKTRTSKSILSAPASNLEGYTKTVGEESPMIPSTESVSDEAAIRKSLAEKAKSINTDLLHSPDLAITLSVPDLSAYSYGEMGPVQIPTSDKKWKVLSFVEMMWSLSDQFGFLNVGPGLAYDIGKWSIGASAGLSIPLPGQKTFGDTNLNFSQNYNFHEKLNDGYFSANSGAESNVVYYENYTMKPGFKFDVFARVQLSPGWSIGLELGRIGFGWDFSQKAVPNQTVAARTDLTDLSSDLWYGGLTAGYALTDHWKVNGGLRFINPTDPSNIGVLPSVRLEYRF